MNLFSFSLGTMLLIFFPYFVKNETSQIESPPPGYSIGDVASDFRLKNVDGKMVSLSDFKDARGFIVTFTSNVCPFARKYEDRLIELHREFAPKGYPVIAINANDPSVEPGDSFEEMKKRAAEKNYPFVYLVDEGQKVLPKFGATKTPQVFLLDKALKVQYIGAIDDNPNDPNGVQNRYVANAILALEKGEKPDPQLTKAIGCSIKTAGNKKRGRRPGPPQGRGGKAPTADELLNRMDKDNDGKISEAEAEGPLKNDFKRLDKNSDGFLTKDELAHAGPPPQRN
jgi:peroxiredoxin